MAARTFILCPGQGAQAVGMGEDLFEASAVARKVFERADSLLGFDISALCFCGPEDRLNQTDISQPALFTAAVASFRAAEDAGIIASDNITAFAGLSLGEYTALHLAGVFSFEDGSKLATARGQYMQAAAAASPSGLVATLAVTATAVYALWRSGS